MAKFAKNVDPKAVAEKQAANVMKQMQGFYAGIAEISDLIF